MDTREQRRPRLLSADGALEVLAGTVTADRPDTAARALLPALAGWLGARAAVLWWQPGPGSRWRQLASWADPTQGDPAAFTTDLPTELADGVLLPVAEPTVQPLPDQREDRRGNGSAAPVGAYGRRAADAGATHKLVIPLPGGLSAGQVSDGLAELFVTDASTLCVADVELLRRVGLQAGAILARLASLADAHATNLLLSAQMEGTPDGTVVVSPDRRVIAHNSRILEMFGVSEDQLRTDAPTEVSLRQVRDAIAHDPSMLRLLTWAHEHITETVRRTVELSDGRVLDMHGAPVFDRDGHYHGRAWYARDITGRTRAELALRAVSDTLQRALRPPRLPIVPGIEFAGRYRAGGEAVEVGGDFYDVFAIGERRWAAVLGDVCGQGAAAATVTALARHTVRAVAAHAGPPSATLAALNTALVEQDPDAPFITAVCLTLTLPPGGQSGPVFVQMSCGGHPSPLLLHVDGSVVSCGRPGSLLGVLDHPVLTDVELTLDAGEALVLVTDGVLEARDDAGNEFGENGLRRVLAGQVGRPAEQVAAAVESAVLSHRRGDRNDDFAILAITVPVDMAVPQ